MIGLCSGDKLRCLHAKLFIPRISTYTTKAEIEETRLKLNAERTIKQNKAAEIGKNIAYNYTVTCIMCAV